jgi:hypothetical protein
MNLREKNVVNKYFKKKQDKNDDEDSENQNQE